MTFGSFPCKVNQPVCLWGTHIQSCTTSMFVQEETGLIWLEAGWLQVCDHAVWCGSVSLYQFELMGGKSNSSGTVNFISFITTTTKYFIYLSLLWLCRLDWLCTLGSGLDEADRDKRQLLTLKLVGEMKRIMCVTVSAIHIQWKYFAEVADFIVVLYWG